MFNQFRRVSKNFKPPTPPHVLNDGSLTLVHAELMVYVPPGEYRTQLLSGNPHPSLRKDGITILETLFLY